MLNICLLSAGIKSGEMGLTCREQGCGGEHQMEFNFSETQWQRTLDLTRCPYYKIVHIFGSLQSLSLCFSHFPERRWTFQIGSRTVMNPVIIAGFYVDQKTLDKCFQRRRVIPSSSPVEMLRQFTKWFHLWPSCATVTNTSQHVPHNIWARQNKQC